MCACKSNELNVGNMKKAGGSSWHHLVGFVNSDNMMYAIIVDYIHHLRRHYKMI